MKKFEQENAVVLDLNELKSSLRAAEVVETERGDMLAILAIRKKLKILDFILSERRRNSIRK